MSFIREITAFLERRRNEPSAIEILIQQCQDTREEVHERYLLAQGKPSWRKLAKRMQILEEEMEELSKCLIALDKQTEKAVFAAGSNNKDKKEAIKEGDRAKAELKKSISKGKDEIKRIKRKIKKLKDGEDAIKDSSTRLSICEFILQEEFLLEDEEMRKELLKFNRKRRNALVGGEAGLGLFRSSYLGGAKKVRDNFEEEHDETSFCARLKQNNPFYWIGSALFP